MGKHSKSSERKNRHRHDHPLREMTSNESHTRTSVCSMPHSKSSRGGKINETSSTRASGRQQNIQNRKRYEQLNGSNNTLPQKDWNALLPKLIPLPSILDHLPKVQIVDTIPSIITRMWSRQVISGDGKKLTEILTAAQGFQATWHMEGFKDVMKECWDETEAWEEEVEEEEEEEQEWEERREEEISIERQDEDIAMSELRKETDQIVISLEDDDDDEYLEVATSSSTSTHFTLVESPAPTSLRHPFYCTGSDCSRYLPNHHSREPTLSPMPTLPELIISNTRHSSVLSTESEADDDSDDDDDFEITSCTMITDPEKPIPLAPGFHTKQFMGSIEDNEMELT